MIFYADREFQSPGYFVYCRPDSVEIAGGQKIHIRGRLKPAPEVSCMDKNGRQFFVVEQSDGNCWLGFHFTMPGTIPYGETADVYGTFIGCHPDTRLPLFEILSCGGINLKAEGCLGIRWQRSSTGD